MCLLFFYHMCQLERNAKALEQLCLLLRFILNQEAIVSIPANAICQSFNSVHSATKCWGGENFRPQTFLSLIEKKHVQNLLRFVAVNISSLV